MAVAGRVTIKVDGQIVINKAGATLDIGGTRNTPVATDQGVVGASAQVVPPMLDVDLAMTDNTDINALNGISNATGVFQPDVGPAFVLTGMFRTDTIKLNPSQQGNVKLQFSALSCQQR